MNRVLVLLALLLVVHCNAARGLDAGTPEPEATPTPTVGTCHGDCNADGEITVDDLIRLVLGILGISRECAIVPYPTGDVTAVILAVSSAIEGCQGYHYRLVPPSSIVYSPPPEVGGEVREEPLSGTFVAVPLDRTTHVYFFLAIRDLDLGSSSFRVVGRPGGTILTLSLGGIEVRPDLLVLIGSDSFELRGFGGDAEISCDISRLPSCPFPPIFHRLPACTALNGEPARDCSNVADGSVPGYVVRLFAVPE